MNEQSGCHPFPEAKPRLTRETAIEISIELWTWLAETGERKDNWPGWKTYGYMVCNCALCEYDVIQPPIRGGGNCPYCPYDKVHGICDREGKPYRKWLTSIDPKSRKQHAQEFLEQLKELK